jgi:hypothetical protein
VNGPAEDEPPPVPRSGVAVISVWFESDEPHPRARITAESGDLEARRERFAAAGVDEICQCLRGWLLTLQP